MNLHNHDIVARDPLHTLDNDTYGIKYLKSHSINELFAELTEKLLSERPLHHLLFLRDILYHKVIKDISHHKSILSKNASSSINVHANTLSPTKTSITPSTILNTNTTSNDSIIHFNFDNTYNGINADRVLQSRTTAIRKRAFSDSDINYCCNGLPSPSSTTYDKYLDDDEYASIGNREYYQSLLATHSEHTNHTKNVIESKLSLLENELLSMTNNAKLISKQIKSNAINIIPNIIPANTSEDDECKLSNAKPITRSKTADNPRKHILSITHRPCFGFDIGGSLTKICCFFPTKLTKFTRNDMNKSDFLASGITYGTSGIRDESLSFSWHHGKFHFINFETARMEGAIELFKAEDLLSKNESFYATGGGAHKYAPMLQSQMCVRIRRGDELKCLLSGLNFLLTHVSDELYHMSNPKTMEPSEKVVLHLSTSDVFPYLLVNIGSGVSIIRVDDFKQFERVSGSQLGGGTYWGLCRLLIGSGGKQPLTYNQAFEMAVEGDSKKVNMLVRDIYGGDYGQCNLPGDLVASAFGKFVSKLVDNHTSIRNNITDGDIARGCLDMIAMNVAQLAYLNAMRFKITRILFAGNFLRQNKLSMAMISFAIHYWSKGEIRACFLKHEGYCGSVGVMLLPEKDLEDIPPTTQINS